MVIPRAVPLAHFPRRSVALATLILVTLLGAAATHAQEPTWTLGSVEWDEKMRDDVTAASISVPTDGAEAFEFTARSHVITGPLVIHIATPTHTLEALLAGEVGSFRGPDVRVARGELATVEPDGTWSVAPLGDRAALDQVVEHEAFCDVKLRADDGVLELWINGALMSRVTGWFTSADELALDVRATSRTVARVTDLRLTPLRARPGVDDDPAWIWGEAPAANGETLFFRRAFETPSALRLAELTVTCDDIHDVYVDGVAVGHDDTWQRVDTYDVTEHLEGETEHVLAIRAQNVGGPAALIARLTLHADGGARTHVATAETWRVATDAPDGWDDVDFDDSAWTNARVVASLGGSPYANVSRNDFDGVARRDTPEATDVANITAPPGFVVERLHTATRDEGSWVSLCVDDRGRLITSDQQGAGLFRITLTPGEASCEVEPLALGISRAQGLLWHADSLYVMVHGGGDRPGGLYRVRDADGDDRLDDVRLLKVLNGTGEHGWHSLVASPDGESIIVVAGNNVEHPTIDSSRVPRHWGEDLLLPRVPDPAGFMAGTTAPGGAIYRIDLDGEHWELLSSGYRNPYDAAFDERGELYTFDADMEWDLNAPWYRPTRVCQVTSGSEYGWRAGSGKWPAWHPDSLPAVLDVGPGSPVGITFGHGANFPAPYRRALLLGDWSYGRIYAAHVSPDEYNTPPSFEPFMTGLPFPVTDMVVHPDGALYIVTGGRGVPSGLYRVSYGGPEEVDSPGAQPRALDDTRVLRRELEELHGRAITGAVDTLWPHLGHRDRSVRFAARVALEWQLLDEWRERALAERRPAHLLGALLALIRTSAPVPGSDPALAARIHTTLDVLDWRALTTTQRLDLLRVEALAIIRLGAPTDARRVDLLRRYSPHFPTRVADVDVALCTLLVALEDSWLAERAVPLLATPAPREHVIALLAPLRLLTKGWTDELRTDYFAQLGAARTFGGGASLGGYIDQIRDQALERVPEPDVARYRAVFDDAVDARSTHDDEPSILAGRTTSTDWTVADLVPHVEARLGEHDFDSGRRLFADAGCFACHRIGGHGGTVGPDLTGAGRRFGVHDMVEALITPSAILSDLYAPSLIVKADGSVVIGQIGNLHGQTLDVIADMTHPERITKIARRDIESIRRSTVSPMPEGLLAPLTADEIADLVTFVLAGGDPEHERFGLRDG